MKLLLSLLAVAGLSGCVAYGGGAYGSGVYYDTAPVYSGGYYVDRGASGYYNGGTYYAPAYEQRRYRDRDRDGVPNRVDRDRDGDGVRNRLDSSPNNPRRY